MDQDQENKEKLKAIRDLIYSTNIVNSSDHTDVLELTEDDLYDDQQEDVPKSFKEKFGRKDLVNQNLTMRNYNSLKDLDQDSLLEGENALKSVEALKILIKKLEKTTEELSKPDRAVTIEDAVKDSLKPYLKEWLNEHLHVIVQNIVDREVKTIVIKNDKKDG